MVPLKVNKRVLILCEGLTEYIYAKALQAELPRALQRSISIEIDYGCQNDPLSLAGEATKRAKKARKERNAYDAVWLFFDHDNSPHLQSAFQLIQREGFEVAYSAICFEHWLILHYENCGRAFQNGAEAVTYLRKFWPTYHKTKAKPFEELRDKLDIAIERVDVLMKNQEPGLVNYERNPYFTIPALVRFFAEIKKNPVDTNG